MFFHILKAKELGLFHNFLLEGKMYPYNYHIHIQIQYIYVQ